MIKLRIGSCCIFKRRWSSARKYWCTKSPFWTRSKGWSFRRSWKKAWIRSWSSCCWVIPTYIISIFCIVGRFILFFINMFFFFGRRFCTSYRCLFKFWIFFSILACFWFCRILVWFCLNCTYNILFYFLFCCEFNNLFLTFIPWNKIFK